MRTRLLALVLAPVIAAGACSSKAPSAPVKVRVAAAADLTKAFTELAGQYKAKTGTEVELTFGASGLLSTQIKEGAPFALFAAANRNYVDQVVQAGKCDGATARSYARGHLVVWTPAAVAPPKELADLTDPRFKKIAIADPAHAPYGKAAKQALEKAGIWPQIQDRIVLGENVQATLTYAQKGNVDAALVALSLALSAEGGASLPVDTALHDPLDQALVVCGTGPEAEAAKQLSEFIASSDGRALMSRYGFVQADDKTPAAAPAGSAKSP